MEQTQEQSGLNGVRGRQMDFASSKPETETSAPVPVTSAKAAINAMYAQQAHPDTPVLAPSAREAVNAAASQSQRNSKSAANLHHGSIQKNMETSRPSASALLQRAKSPQLSSAETTPRFSFDPLARTSAPKPKVKTEPKQQDIPVIRTSLKLGSSARPKPTPVILPPNSRMARVARPVGAKMPSKLTQLLSHRPVDAQIIQPNTINPSGRTKQLASGQKSLAKPSNDGQLEVQILSSKAPAKAPSTAPPKPAAKVPRPAGPVRDPQMRAGSTVKAHVAGKASAAPLWPNAAASALSPKPKFRSAPKGYAAAAPSSAQADSTYVMTAPPKLNLSHSKPAAEEAEFGVVEDYHAPRAPEPLGDKAPIGRLKAQEVASGHGGSADAPAIKADNTSNYSFSRKDKEKPKPVDNNRYALGGQSPFLKTVNVEKRPLSDNAAPARPNKIERPKIDDKSTKSSRKNVYAKKHKSKSEVRQELPQRPTVIIPSSRRSKVPLFFLILATIILGAIVGAAAYLCFFQ